MTLAEAGLAPGGLGADAVMLEGDRAYLLPGDDLGGTDALAAERDLDALIATLPRARPRRRAILIGALVLVVVAAAALGLVLAQRDDAGPSPSAEAKPGPAGRIVARIPFGADGPASIAFDGERAWVMTLGGKVQRLDTTTNSLVGAPRKISPFGGAMLVHDGSLWAPGAKGLLRLDPETLRVTGRVDFDRLAAVYAYEFAGDSLWVTDGSQGRALHGALHRLDPDTGREIGDPVRLPYGEPIALSASGSSLWAGAREGGTVTRIDVVNGGRQTTVVGAEVPLFATAEPGGVWIPTSSDGTLVHVTDDGQIERIVQIGGRPFSAVRVGDDIWVQDFEDPAVTRVSRTTGRILGSSLPLEGFGPIVSGVRALWSVQEKSILRIAPTSPAPEPVDGPRAEAGRLLGGPIPAGTRFRTPGYADALSLEVPSADWILTAPQQPDGIGVLNRHVVSDPAYVSINAPRSLFLADGGLRAVRTPAQAMAVLRSRRDLAVGAARTTRVGGQPAIQVNVSSVARKPIKDLCATPCSLLFPLSDGLTFSIGPPDRIRVWLLQRQGGLLLIYYDLAGITDDARYRAEAEQIVRSIRFEDTP